MSFKFFILGTDTEFSESEALSSLQISGAPKSPPPVQSKVQEHQVLKIETKQAPKPSQPEVVLSDGKSFLIFPSLLVSRDYFL